MIVSNTNEYSRTNLPSRYRPTLNGMGDATAGAAPTNSWLDTITQGFNTLPTIASDYTALNMALNAPSQTTPTPAPTPATAALTSTKIMGLSLPVLAVVGYMAYKFMKKRRS